MNKIRIKKEDRVVIITGKYRDRTTPRRVLQVYPKRRMLLVEGVNLVKRHTKPNPQRNIKGGVIESEGPIHISNVMLLDPETKRGTRIGTKTLEDGRRVRMTRASGTILDK
ncbi:MAG: 50S ribosomal protein L24 [Acidobacteriota bacterium]|nr:50S ribosomal protein L24 [Acidobacteriota bacterium]MDH3785525.1 50S ribosomal protein L24 [Acidobacteriota bacterium]